MTNEDFLILLHNKGWGDQILWLDTVYDKATGKDVLAAPKLNADGTKTYRFESYGGQEYVYVYYAKFDQQGNLIDLYESKEESFLG